MIKEVKGQDLKDFIELNNNPFRRYFSYEEDNQILGYFIIDILYEKIELINIFVNKDARNRKIGSNMIEYLIKFGKNNKKDNITLEVKEDNLYAIKLYEKYHFRKVAIRKGYYNGTDGILMELSL